jgi:hypothetical protein
MACHQAKDNPVDSFPQTAYRKIFDSFCSSVVCLQAKDTPVDSCTSFSTLQYMEHIYVTLKSDLREK